MERFKNHLFYSPKEKLLFYVAGYTDNSDNVSEIVAMLKKTTQRFLTVAKAKEEDMNTFLVAKSQRYKQMRVFYAKTDVIPDKAFVIEGEGWTMQKWIEY